MSALQIYHHSRQPYCCRSLHASPVAPLEHSAARCGMMARAKQGSHLAEAGARVAQIAAAEDHVADCNQLRSM